MSGTAIPIVWQGRQSSAWLPFPLADRSLALSEHTIRQTERAAAAIRRGSDSLPAHWESLARLLLRAEGMASSYLEGLAVPLADVALAELDPSVGATAALVADNLAAVRESAAGAGEGPLTVKSLHRWHRTLMGNAGRLPGHLVGDWRDAQGWIGGTSPLDAALVPPPPDHIDRLMEDLIGFANRTDLDPVTQAAAAHAQFEVIHPYGDGNGRVGRVLIGWLLTRRLNLVTPPPVSVRIAADRGGYLAGLTMYRLGDVDPWVSWFADTVSDAGDAVVTLVRDVEDLQEDWRVRLADVRADSVARRIIMVLPKHPVLSAGTAAAELGISVRACSTALQALAGRGIVVAFDTGISASGRPRQWWVARELVDLVHGWSGRH